MSCPLQTAKHTVSSKRFLKYDSQWRQENVEDVNSFNQLTHISPRSLILKKNKIYLSQ